MPRFPSRRDSPDPESEGSTETDSAAEESPQQPVHSAASGILHFASQLTSSFSTSPSKRRLPGYASSSAASHARDAKSRKREEAGSRRNTGHAGSHAGGWVEGKEKREKEDLVDIPLAEHFRKEFGDPFLEIAIETAA